MLDLENPPGRAEQQEARRRRIASIRTIWGLGVVALLAQAGWAMLNFSALPVWVKYHLGMEQYLGIIISAFMITEAVLRPWLGALSDKIGRKPLMLAGPFLSIFTAIATIYVSHPLLLILLRGIDGVGLAAFWPAAFAAVGDAVEEKSRSSAMAVVNGTGLAGIALAMPLGGLANDYIHLFPTPYTGAFVGVSLIFALTVIAGLVIFPREAHKHEHVHTEEEEHLHLRDKSEVKSVLHLVPDMLILSVVVFIAIGLLMPIVKLYAMEQLEMSEVQFGMMVLPIAAVLGVFSVVFGKYGDKWGRVPTFGYGLLSCAVGMWLIATIRSITVMGAASILLGLGFAVAMPAWMAMAAQAAPPNRRGQVLGAVGMAQGIGAIIGVWIGPIIYSNDWMSLPQLRVDHVNLPFYLCAILLSVCTVLAFHWVCVRRCKQNSGRVVSKQERRAVLAVAMIGAVVIGGWVVMRYTRPLPADRIAWLWVRDVVHSRPVRATRFTVKAFETRGPDGLTPSQEAARYYPARVNRDRARYRLSRPVVSSDGQHAEVQLVFRYPKETGRLEERQVKATIYLVRLANGEWRISGKKEQPSQ